MEWLTDHKIPVGKTAKSVFDWLQHHGAWFFDGLAEWMESGNTNPNSEHWRSKHRQ